jgi:hypothetical protein
MYGRGIFVSVHGFMSVMSAYPCRPVAPRMNNRPSPGTQPALDIRRGNL